MRVSSDHDHRDMLLLLAGEADDVLQARVLAVSQHAVHGSLDGQEGGRCLCSPQPGAKLTQRAARRGRDEGREWCAAGWWRAWNIGIRAHLEGRRRNLHVADTGHALDPESAGNSPAKRREGFQHSSASSRWSSLLQRAARAPSCSQHLQAVGVFSNLPLPPVASGEPVCEQSVRYDEHHALLRWCLRMREAMDATGTVRQLRQPASRACGRRVSQACRWGALRGAC